MCLICGTIGKVDKHFIQTTLSQLSFRGSDSFGLYNGKDIFISDDITQLTKQITHLDSLSLVQGLLARNGFVPQPLQAKGVLVTNCELYSWESIKKEQNLSGENDSQVLLSYLDASYDNNTIITSIQKLKGAFALAYLRGNTLYLARDVFGEKPLFYYIDELGNLYFSSEKKSLPNYENSIELNPREVLEYEVLTKKLHKHSQELKLPEETNLSKETFLDKTRTYLEQAILSQIPKNQKVGILFSGGIDSTFIAYVLYKHNIEFTCYTSALEGGRIEEASDYYYAKKIAKQYGMKLQVEKIHVENLQDEVKEVLMRIEDTDYIKVSVALPFHLACKKAKANGVKVLFSGLGSEEIFAGYKRHKQVALEKVNQECLHGLLSLHSRDLYRDDVITMTHSIELRLPFLDRELVDFALSIPVEYKLSKDKVDSKVILREIAYEMGLDKEYAFRQKKAAQYGSKFDKGLLRLAKDNGVGKQKYLNSLAETLEGFKGIIRYDWESQ